AQRDRGHQRERRPGREADVPGLGPPHDRPTLDLAELVAADDQPALDPSPPQLLARRGLARDPAKAGPVTQLDRPDPRPVVVGVLPTLLRAGQLGRAPAGRLAVVVQAPVEPGLREVTVVVVVARLE